jgi:hypothetical protein
MNTLFKKIPLSSVSYLIIALFAVLIANKAVFIHSHNVNGRIVIHAHPYRTSEHSKSSKTHHHTDAQYLFFDNLSVFFSVDVQGLLLVENHITTNKPLEIPIKIVTRWILTYSGRDPPLTILSF